MKIAKHLLSAVLAFALFAGTVPLCAASAPSGGWESAVSTAVVNASSESADAADMESFAAELREFMRKRTENFRINISGSFIRTNEDITDAFERALFETGKGDEGDYLRWSLKAYGYEPAVDYRGALTGLDFSIEYNTNAAQEAEVDRLTAELEDALGLREMSECEMIRTVYAYVVENVSYSHDMSGRLIFSAYSALVNGEAVCQGYAQLVYRLLTDCGVSCRIIPGNGNGGNHAWNLAAVSGKYYWLDTTWDSNAGKNSRMYMLRGTDDFDALDLLNTHSLESWDGMSQDIYTEYKESVFFSRYNVSASAYDGDCPSPALGDMDGNGAVDATDASDVLEAYARLSTEGVSGLTPEQTVSADADGDGRLDSSDASLFLSYYSYVSTGGALSFTRFRDDLTYYKEVKMK